MNGVKIHNQWRRIMRMAKTEELRQDIEILSQSYDRNVDRKDALIQVSDCDTQSCAFNKILVRTDTTPCDWCNWASIHVMKLHRQVL